jgi:hypothetical protein
MSSSILYMSMSLDGFIAGPADDVGNGLGNGGERACTSGCPTAAAGSGRRVSTARSRPS